MKRRKRDSYADDPFPPAETPMQDYQPRIVDYSDRGPADFIVSGPLWPAKGPGRTFFKVAHALQWARNKYGESNVRVVKECLESTATRWAVLIKAGGTGS